MRKVKTRKSIKIDELEDLLYRRVQNSPFKQQRLPAWRPVPTLGVIITIYVIFGIIFIGIGITTMIFSDKIKTIEIRYDQTCLNQTICTINFTIPEDMEKPIMVYYQLVGFYQNHRRYVKSKSNKQLYGEYITLQDMKNDEDCDPVYTNEQMNLSEKLMNESGLNPKEIAIPCGLMAKTYFTDVFEDWKLDGENITVNDTGIAWEKDINLFKNTPKPSMQWIDITNEHFIVWMRASGLPDFKKLWGRIKDNDLKKGQVLTLNIQNNYDVSYYQGQKILVLGTTNYFGGRNDFLAISFIVVGSISFVLAVVFPIINNYQVQKEKEKEKTN